ncbi:lithostathine-1 isoform X2 [Diabrotica virgifera virgifera]|uniref:C-type lectin domain-containing protein n=1 Tax=Diabrotica virgifera virgifera TaxID=50390 RepID=A0ABM5KNI5_DIAVI|nr:lithostathine-1 isoform X2 [Diabrotica virgifera virgifera]
MLTGKNFIDLLEQRVLETSFINMCFKFVGVLILVNLFSSYHVDAQIIDQVGDVQSQPSLHLIVNGSKSYYIGDVFQGNFFRSEQFCRQHGMNLVSIGSSAENDFLKTIIVKEGDGSVEFWTSGTKLPDSNRWIWFTTGRTITYFNWLQRQPDANKDYQCIQAKIINNLLQWSNKDCWEEYHFICETTRAFREGTGIPAVDIRSLVT